MPLETITRRFGFDTAHRVLGHESKCANLHGHRYVAEVTCRAPQLDKLGRHIDFSELKTRIGGWIDEKWDHNIILHPNDPLLKTMKSIDNQHVDNPMNAGRQGVLPSQRVFGPKTPYTLGPSDPQNDNPSANPTAENMVRHLYHMCQSLMSGTQIDIVSVRLYETPNCWADYTKLMS